MGLQGSVILVARALKEEKRKADCPIGYKADVERRYTSGQAPAWQPRCQARAIMGTCTVEKNSQEVWPGALASRPFGTLSRNFGRRDELRGTWVVDED